MRGRIMSSEFKNASSHPFRSARAGFTLLEILVVIGIIAILMSIIRLVVAHARRIANEVTCQNNLRQLMTAFRAFAVDHGDQLPGGYWDAQLQFDPNPDHMDWLAGSTQKWSSAPNAGTIYRYVNNPKIYLCPSLDIQAPAANAVLGPQVGSNGQFDYVSMLDFTGARLSNIPPTSRWMSSTTQFENFPTPVIVEGDPHELNGFGMKDWHAGIDPMRHDHHGGAFYASVDGSVQWINEQPGGCANWWAAAPSGTWVSLGAYPFQWGMWNAR